MARLPYTIPYDENFLGNGLKVPLPVPRCGGVLYRTGEVIDYIHFSLVMHENRKSALYTAHNIDASQIQSVRRTGWDTDPRLPHDVQTDNSAYRNNDYDRGHLVRRAAVAWGASQRAKDASDSTFYYTNAALQHSTFNQSNSKWLGLENWVLQKAGGGSSRLCVFTGPIYTKIDNFERGYRIPSAFFKIIVLKDPTSNEDDLSALGFVMTQNEGWRLWRNRALTNLEPYVVSILDIEHYTGLHFGQLSTLDEYNWRQPRFRNRNKMTPFIVNGPDDITFNGNKRRNLGIRATRHLEQELTRNGILHEAHTESCTSCSSSGNLKDRQLWAVKTQLDNVTGLLEDLLEKEMEATGARAVRSAFLRNRLQRVVGGIRVPLGKYPECCAVGNDDRYFCTGVLVHENVVLTAAHCVPEGITRVMLKSRQVFDTDSAEIINVKSVFQHPEYSNYYLPAHDIAVLILEEASTVKPAKIGNDNAVNDEDTFEVVGFGSDDFNGQTGFGTKRIGVVNALVLVDRDEGFIESKEQEHGFEYDYEFHAGKFGSGIDSCFGDSGGPIYLTNSSAEDSDERYVGGLTARGSYSSINNCGDGGIYTRIYPYLPWIAEVTGLQLSELGGESDDGRNESNHQQNAGLYISSAMPNPSGGDAGNEWVEITNGGPNSLNLEDYFLSDKQGGRLNLSGSITSRQKSRIKIPAGNSIKLGNRGDEIILKDNEGEIIHKVDYTSAGSGQIINFDAPVIIEDETNCGNNGGSQNDTQADPC